MHYAVHTACIRSAWPIPPGLPEDRVSLSGCRESSMHLQPLSSSELHLSLQCMSCNMIHTTSDQLWRIVDTISRQWEATSFHTLSCTCPEPQPLPTRTECTECILLHPSALATNVHDISCWYSCSSQGTQGALQIVDLTCTLPCPLALSRQPLKPHLVESKIKEFLATSKQQAQQRARERQGAVQQALGDGSSGLTRHDPPVTHGSSKAPAQVTIVVGNDVSHVEACVLRLSSPVVICNFTQQGLYPTRGAYQLPKPLSRL